jgi:glycosyltransferase involved in cell wall biosynthesis
VRPADSGETSQRPIAFLLASLAAGGAERVALNLAEAFRSAGIRIDILVVNCSGPLLDQVPSNIRIVDLRSRRARGAVSALRRYVRAEGPRAIISIAFQANLLALAATLGLRRRPRLVLTVHSTISRAFRGLRMIRRWVLTAATRLLYRWADAVVTVSHGAASDLVEFGISAGKMMTIHNPVLRPDFGKAVREKVNHPWLADGGDPVVVTVGRLTEAKNQRLLLEAFQILLRRKPARLMVVGDGELKPVLEARAADLGIAGKVAFTGRVGNPLPYMRCADVFVLSSAWEGFGNVLVEAMATGTPVVSTDCPHGPREILEGGKWGRLVPVGERQALASAMLAVLDGGGIDARTRAQHFTVKAAADRYLALLAQLGVH